MALLNDSKSFREQNLNRNIYSKNKQYTTGHKNTLSDGDEKGKDGVGDQIGSATDILARNSMVAKNKYNKNKMCDRVEETPL